jgi:hypothetical protein
MSFFKPELQTKAMFDPHHNNLKNHNRSNKWEKIPVGLLNPNLNVH